MPFTPVCRCCLLPRIGCHLPYNRSNQHTHRPTMTRKSETWKKCRPQPRLILLEVSLTVRSTLRNEQQSPLLRLPLGLRNRILELVLQGSTIHLKTLERVTGRPSNEERLVEHNSVQPFLSLTKVCRQLHSGVTRSPIALDVFKGTLPTVLKFLAGLDAKYLSRVRAVHTRFELMERCYRS